MMTTTLATSIVSRAGGTRPAALSWGATARIPAVPSCRHAYVVRAVNRLGVESGLSPYALTIPSTPRQVFLREREDDVAEIRWAENPERAIAGYRIYKLGASHWEIVRVNDEPVRATTFRHDAGEGTTRYWVVAVDRLGQEGQPSSAVWYRHDYRDFFEGEWHQ